MQAMEKLVPTLTSVLTSTTTTATTMPFAATRRAVTPVNVKRVTSAMAELYVQTLMNATTGNTTVTTMPAAPIMREVSFASAILDTAATASPAQTSMNVLVAVTIATRMLHARTPTVASSVNATAATVAVLLIIHRLATTVT